MNKIINHDDTQDHQEVVTDIDARFGLEESLADNETIDPKSSSEGEKHPSNSQASARQKSLTLTMAEIKHIYNEEVEKAVDEKPENVGILQKISAIVQFPVEIVSMAIIPNVDDEKIGRWYTPILPFTSMLAFITITKST